jgi:hypothetical protein
MQVTEQLDNTLFRGLIDYYASAQHEDNPGKWPRAAQQFNAASFDRALRGAETFYLAPDMQLLAMLAAEDFPLDEVIVKQDLPAEVGFLYLPSRFRQIELRGRLMIIHAVLWAGSQFWCLTDRYDPDDEISASLRETEGKTSIPIAQVGRWDVNLTGGFHFGEPIPQTIQFPQGVLPPDATVSWTMQEGRQTLVSDHAIGVAPTMAPMPVMRLLLATWRLMQQTLAEVSTTEDHPRAFRRRAVRHQVPSRVVVIALRRRKSHATGTGPVLTYRTMTRGHWKNVWVGPLDGGPDVRYTRRIYVHEYIRGPEGAPLIIRNRVNALIR